MHQISEFRAMGANIHYNSYFPGYYSTGNHNLIANGSKWNHNLSPDKLLGYYREALKQTMLKQEMTFRDQIQDLHRLYGRQRELMDEVRRNELDNHQLKMEASLLTTALCQSSSLHVQKTFHIPSLPLVNSVCSQSSVSGAESTQLPSCFVQGRNIQAFSYPTPTEGHSGDCELLEPKCKKFKKDFLDLQLPADAYMDNEVEDFLDDGKVTKAPEVPSSYVKRFPEVVCNGDAKQFLGTNGFSYVSEDETSTTASLGKGSADLNDPYKLEEETCPTSDNFVCPTSHLEIPCSEISQKKKADLQFLSKEFIQENRTRQDIEVCPNVLLQERKGKQEGSSYPYEAGNRKRTLNSFPRGFHAEKLTESFSALHLELKKAELPTFHQSNQNSWSEGINFGLHSSRRNCSQHLPSGASSLSMSYQHIPEDEMANSGSSCIAALRQPIHDYARVPIAVQALPCFNSPVPFSNSSKPSTVRPGLDKDGLQLRKALRSSTKHGSVFVPDSSFSNGSQLESKNSEARPPHISIDNLMINGNLVREGHGITKYVQDSENVKSPKDINLNFMPPSCSLDVAVSCSFQATTKSEKLDESNEGLPWNRPRLVDDGKPDKGCEDLNYVEASYPSSKRTHGSATSCENPNFSSDCCSHGSPSNAKKRKNAVAFDLNLASDSVLDTEIELTEHAVENEFDKKDVGFGSHIDLNSSINGDEFSAMPSLSTETLLEAPASPENKECSPPRGESDENQVETPVLLSVQEDLENKKGSPLIRESDENQIDTPCLLSGQKVDLKEELVRTAAESLVSISSSGLQNCIVRTADMPLNTSCNSLHWFAGIASSVLCGPENNVGVVVSEELLPDGMDYFEVMTLNLTETKVEDCCCTGDGHKQEEMGISSSQIQPRKGRTMRGRQRKDFQREVLPGLASLSRYEVTEDLQTIGGLIESSGNRWETGSVKYAAKLGLARGRRRSSISTSAVTDQNSLESLLKQIGSKSRFEKEERSLICWGEVTRRRRGQRYPVSKSGLILSQV